MSSDNPYNYDPNQFQSGPPQKSNTGMIIAIVVGIVAIPVLLACAGIVVALLLPAVQAGREAARRMECSNNLKQIALAMHNYHDSNKSFPPPYTVDATGQRLHSWRTLLLPYLEQKAVYDQIDLNKPWDDPANIALSNVVIPSYACPSTMLAPGDTTYVAVVDPSAIMSGPVGVHFGQIKDGTSNTLLIVETDPSHAVNWMSPDDIDMPTFLNAGADRHSHTGGANMALADGSVQFIAEQSDPAIRQSLTTKAGGD